MDSFPVSEDMLPVVLSLVDDSDSEVRASVAYSLSEYPDSTEACNALRAMMNDDDPFCRVRAAFLCSLVFGRLDEAALAILRTASLDTSEENINACCAAVADLIVLAGERPALITDIATAFRNNPWIRLAEVGMLRHLGAAGVPILEDLLTDDDAYVRERAATALSWIGRDAGAAVPALVNALRDPKPEVRREAARALSQIDPDRYPEMKADN